MVSDIFARALILAGPTASGKTELSLELADRLDVEIVSMDSMVLYRGMDIGTAKPGPEERRRIPHHLIDVLDPWESASVAWWLDQAAQCCQDIESRGKRVLLVGGTPLYLKALLRGLFDGPSADPVLRRRLMEDYERDGPQFLHQRLAQVDPVSASRLHPNDIRRIIRALEVWELSGQQISARQQQWTVKVKDGRSRIEDRASWENRCLWLDVPREELYRRIDARVHEMVTQGWLEEARHLRRLPRPLSKEASQALGYKELFAYLDAQLSLEQAIERIQTRSRNFAKRQISWFRHLPECRPANRELTLRHWCLTMK